METMNRKQLQDIRLIGKFVELYCAGKHSAAERAAFRLPHDLGERTFCPECTSFVEYAIIKRLKCPLEADKPTCKHCRIHCYDKPHLERVREIMSYSGRKLMMRGRLDYVWHYFF